ncbi:MAG TPA: palindromic element RPE4 domain-containing protein [Rickettsia endosymbiont of Omalisus fontisbellaquei]|nr:palindromic element RPE4 domain-containing protein [Rickettsia endosymbiont of Omalisus fontisbellaquei]
MSTVTPWLDHGVQSLFYFFLDTVVKPRYDN